MSQEILIGEKVTGDSSWSGDSKTVAGQVGAMHGRHSFLVDSRFLVRGLSLATDVRMRINYNTAEGKELTAMLANKTDKKIIRTYLTELYLRKVDPKDFLTMLKQARQQAKSKGIRMQQRKIKHALGLA